MKAPYFRNLSASQQVLMFFLLAFVTLSLFSLVAFLFIRPFYGVNILTNPEILQDLNDPLMVQVNRWLLLFNHLGLFIFPALIFDRLTRLPGEDLLRTRGKLDFSLLMLSLLVFLTAFAPINFLADWNMSISFGSMDSSFRAMEESATALQTAFLSDQRISAVLFNVLIFAVVPAIGEELFFRAVLLRLTYRFFKNIHVAVWLGGFVFALIHFQFYGFIPRMLLGVLLGYVVVWTGKLGYAMLIHFVNNLTAVILGQLVLAGKIPEHWSMFGAGENERIPLLISVLILTGSLLIIRKRSAWNQWREEWL